MTELKVDVEKIYTITGLTFSDIELICVGLDYMNDDSVVNQRDKIVAAIDAAL